MYTLWLFVLVSSFAVWKSSSCPTTENFICETTCTLESQILVQVKPASYVNSSCNTLHASPNLCCLLKSRHSIGMDIVFQNWCCTAISLVEVQKNIANTAHVLSSLENLASVGTKTKRDISDGKHTSVQGGRKKEESIGNVLDELEKVYSNTYIHPVAARDHQAKKDHINKQRLNHVHKPGERDSNNKKRNLHDNDENTPKSNGGGIIASSEPNKPVKVFSSLLSNEIFSPMKIEDSFGSPFILEDRIFSQDNVKTSSFTWNLDRIDQRSRPLDNQYKPRNSGTSTSSPAKSIHIYVVDTGLQAAHVAFASVNISMDYPSAGGAVDCHGHGTHVASTVAGLNVGVLSTFPRANPPNTKYNIVIHVVRVLDCTGSGSIFDVVSGLLWIYDNVEYPALVTMSLGSSRSFSLDSVTSSLISDKHIPVMAAAGNANGDACLVSPAAATGVIAVGSTGSTDQRSSFSNYGTCVRLYGPGEDILGAYYIGTNSYQSLSGTSMATPQVTGSVAANVLDYQHEAPDLLHSAEYGLSKFLNLLTLNKVGGNLGGGPNAFCYVGNSTSQGAPLVLTSSHANEISHTNWFSLRTIFIYMFLMYIWWI